MRCASWYSYVPVQPVSLSFDILKGGFTEFKRVLCGEDMGHVQLELEGMFTGFPGAITIDELYNRQSQRLADLSSAVFANRCSDPFHDNSMIQSKNESVFGIYTFCVDRDV